MAEFILKNPFVSVGGVDLSDHVKQLTVNHSAEIKDITAMGSNSRVRLGGLKDWSVDLEFNQDFASGSVHATLFSAVGTSVAVVIRPDAGAKSATNPELTGNAILESYPPLGGSVGDESVTSASLQGSGDLSSATS